LKFRNKGFGGVGSEVMDNKIFGTLTGNGLEFSTSFVDKDYINIAHKSRTEQEVEIALIAGLYLKCQPPNYIGNND